MTQEDLIQALKDKMKFSLTPLGCGTCIYFQEFDGATDSYANDLCKRNPDIRFPVKQTSTCDMRNK